MYTNCVLARRVSVLSALEGCTAVALMAEHDDARQARPMTTIEQAVCTGERNLRACTRISLRPILQWAALEGCTAVAQMTTWRRKTGKQAVCAHLWRADACAQGVPVARTAGGPYGYGSNGDSQEDARVQGIRRTSPTC